MTEAFSDRQFLIVQREKEALVGGGESGGPYNSSCSASDKIWTRSSNAMDLAQKTKSYSNRAQIGISKSNTPLEATDGGASEHCRFGRKIPRTPLTAMKKSSYNTHH